MPERGSEVGTFTPAPLCRLPNQKIKFNSYNKVSLSILVFNWKIFLELAPLSFRASLRFPHCSLYLTNNVANSSGRITHSIWFGARLAPQPILLIFLLYNRIKVEIISNIRYYETLYEIHVFLWGSSPALKEEFHFVFYFIIEGRRVLRSWRTI